MASYYELLGVSSSVTAEELKTCYKKLVFQYHPDRNKDPKAEERLKQITSAYETLSDPAKRRQYDDGINPKERPRITASITLREAVFGTICTADVWYYEECRTCNGLGTQPLVCADCSGSGRKDWSYRGQWRKQACSTCSGIGRIKNKTRPCDSCHGQRKVRIDRTLTIPIPAGIEDGQIVYLTGPSYSHTRTLKPKNQQSFAVAVKVIPHPLFKRNGNDLLTFGSLIEGVLEYTSVEDKVCQLKVAKGTKSGDVVRVPGQGSHDVNRIGVRGDLLVTVI
jgi:molecular chaperone DnaJ